MKFTRVQIDKYSQIDDTHVTSTEIKNQILPTATEAPLRLLPDTTHQEVSWPLTQTKGFLGGFFYALYKWNRTTYILLCLSSFLKITFVRFTWFIVCSCRSLILIAVQKSRVWLYHNLFIHVTTDGHCSSFKFWPMNILVWVFCWIYICLAVDCLRVELLDHGACIYSALVDTANRATIS